MLESLGITKDLIADLIINIGSIIVLFVIVKKLAYKPIKRFMDDRTARVTGEMEAAQKLSDESTAKAQEYDALLKECETAKVNAIKEGKREALKESERIVTEAKNKAEDIVAKAERKAREKEDRALEEANDYIVNLIMDGSSHLLKREITDDDNRKIVEDFLKACKGDENA